MNKVKYIDLFSGMGGIKLGFEQALSEFGLKGECLFFSEIKPYAISVLKQNNTNEENWGDIVEIKTEKIPDFDILLGGFPCQAFSSAGKRLGFADTRGTMFFEIERILRAKKPKGFILENVEGLVNHDKGRTFSTIINSLKEMGYKVSYQILNAKNFGVAQDRKRIYIVGSLKNEIFLSDFSIKKAKISDILETGKPLHQSNFVEQLLSHFSVEELYGKSIKDKRGGKNNIHSWDIETKGSISKEEKELLNHLLLERRKKKWADIIGIDWMDGMPLTTEQISEFYQNENLQKMLDNLVEKGYVKYEHPKKLVKEENKRYRIYDETKPKGYNIVAGKLSFEVSKILSPNDVAPTLVAMDMQKIFVVDGKGLRRLTLREGLRLFGYPENYQFDIDEKQGFDLLGNTVAVPVIKAISERLIQNVFL